MHNPAGTPPPPLNMTNFQPNNPNPNAGGLSQKKIGDGSLLAPAIPPSQQARKITTTNAMNTQLPPPQFNDQKPTVPLSNISTTTFPTTPMMTSTGGPQNPIQQQQQPSGSNTYQNPSAGYATRPNTNRSRKPADITTTKPKPKNVSKPARQKSSGSSRIDAEMIPRPTGISEPIRDPGGRSYTAGDPNVPSVSSVFTVKDNGSASPRFMRMTANLIPVYTSTTDVAHIPLALYCQPFADIPEREEQPPELDLGEEGPFRCPRCNAYVNAFCDFSTDGKQCSCNFCRFVMDVPAHYTKDDEWGSKKHKYGKDELKKGTVDFVAPMDYDDFDATVPNYCFIIDVTRRAVQGGYFHTAIEAIRRNIANLPPMTSVSIITYDDVVHFYTLDKDESKQPQMTVMSDIDDPFVPIAPHLLLNKVSDRQDQLYTLLDSITEIFAAPTRDQSSGGAALAAGVELISNGGGQVLYFSGSLPTIGVGTLEKQSGPVAEDSKAVGKKQYFQKSPEEKKKEYYSNLAETCTKKSVSVDMFCTSFAPVNCINPNQDTRFVDVKNLSQVPLRTGGQFFHYPTFDHQAEAESLSNDVTRIISRFSAMNCIAKVRASKSVSVDCLYAPWPAEQGVDRSSFVVPRLSSDSNFMFTFKHDDKIETSRAYVQIAILYTNPHGKRLIRVHTMGIPCANSLSNMFRQTDIDVVTALMTRQACIRILANHAHPRELLTNQVINVLHAYRSNCASATSAGQLILPESLKMLPLFILSLMKMAAFRPSDVRPDERHADIAQLLTTPLVLATSLIYPRIYPVHPMNEKDFKGGTETGISDNVFLPHTIACSSTKVLQEGVYIIQVGSKLMLSVGNNVDEQYLMDVFGVPHLRAVDRHQLSFTNSEEAYRIQRIANQIPKDRAEGGITKPLRIVIPQSRDEALAWCCLVEDAICGEVTYVDYLCQLHRDVQQKID